MEIADSHVTIRAKMGVKEHAIMAVTAVAKETVNAHVRTAVQGCKFKLH